MENLQAASDARLLPHRRLRFIVFEGCVLIIGTWAQFHFTNLQVKSNPTSEPDLNAAKEKAEPLLRALEKYRADNGLYPATLDQLSPEYFSSVVGPHSYRYSAHYNDWAFKSGECAEREKSLHGWILKEAKEYEKEVSEFKLECVTGYRYYQLQSRNFPHDPQLGYIDRWAYYDSSNRQWSVGWCSHATRSRGSAIGINGVCRWAQHGVPDPW